MAATFPGGVKVFTTKQAGDQIASAHINDLQDEVVAVETELRKTSGSVVSHGSLAGLNNNDHPQYLLTTGKAADSDKLDGKDSSYYALVGHNHPFDCCKVRRKDGQTIENSTWTAISWTGEDFDTNNMWSSGSEITIKTSGYYHIEIYVELGKNTVGQRCAYLKINSNIITRVDLMPMNTTTFPTTAMISWEGTLALNDKVSAFVWQNSGDNLSVSATYNSTMTVRQVVGN